ncbi:Scr1 family TA system antitoxin-like transcriptional regulator [Streptomyces sp. DW26H14]|uniref:Scr1 family TA system antitoxin-like transcriptional regulator n=1 Tax=Streptomyces sp. DW26H14 TaxID=3435395 RepID=UPI00403D8E1C
MTTEPHPVSRRALGAELKRLRTAKRFELKEAAEFLDTSPTRAGRMESGKGRVAISPEEIRKLCELYGVTDEQQIEKLLSMLPDAKKPGWWEPFRDTMPPGLEVLFEMEEKARAKRAWESALVPGLLQTPAYARAVLAADSTIHPADVDDLVTARAQRQVFIAGEDDRRPLEMWAILDEQVLRRPVGTPEVMREQIDHLIEVSTLPHVTLQILPVAKGAHPGLLGSFSLLEFDAEPPVAYVESHAGNIYLEKTPDVRRLTAQFDMLRALARDPQESTAILHSARRENE